MNQPWVPSSGESQAYNGKVGLLFRDRETIGMALPPQGSRTSHRDSSAGWTRQWVRPQGAYGNLFLQRSRVDDHPVQTVPRRGPTGLHSARGRGPMIAGYIYYLPKGTPASAPRLSEGTKDKNQKTKKKKKEADFRTTCFAICSNAEAVASRHPSSTTSSQRRRLENSRRFNGYQPPAQRDRPEHPGAEWKSLPETLATSVLTNDDLRARLAHVRDRSPSHDSSLGGRG